MTLAMDAAALQAFLNDTFESVADDFVVDQVADDGVLIRLKVDKKHLRPGGTVSGPSMFALADVSIYLAILSRIGPVALAVTTNCSIDFMRKPAADTPILCYAHLHKLGRVLAVGDALLFNDGARDKPLARATLTYSIPPSS